MTEQPKALRLADELKSVHGHRLALDAAAELRRMYALNQELLEALKLADALLWGANMNAVVVERKVKAAIAKGEQA